MKKISAKDLVQKAKHGNVQIIDVRSLDEFAYKHIPGAVNVPVELIEARLHDIPKDKEVFLICQSGMRSSTACQKLENLGLANVASVEGGLSAYESASGQIIQESTIIPVMRQVQIAAGSLVLLGVLLSKLLHPAFIWLSAFVGAGLLFAGLSGFCGMALLLAKLPWNRVRASSCKI